MSDPVARLNAALEGRYAIECEPGEGGMARRVRAIYGKGLNKWGLLVPPPRPDDETAEPQTVKKHISDGVPLTVEGGGSGESPC